MTFLKNTISLLAVCSIIPTAYAAAAARPSIMNAFNTASAASRRMPSGRTSSATPVANTAPSSTGILDKIECIDAYTECIASDDACGSDFEECTTNVLFHAQMPKCTSTLLQCTSAGINRLFGTTDGNVASLSNVDSYVADTDDTEVARYTFPSDGSVMGQRIIAGAIANTYDTQSCVKNYMRCLNKDDVCGADFELCTTNADFKKQSFACESTLARCQTAGHKELFGERGLANKFKADAESRIGEAITNGAELAALNAVTTCYKIADNCLLSVCKQNPLRCIEGTSVDLLRAANEINADGTEDSAALNEQGKVTSDVTKSYINRFLRSSCEDKIGSNKYCHMTVFEKTPSKKDLANIDKISEVFEEVLDLRKGNVLSQVQGLAQKFDSDAKAACTKTIQECAMRTCGGGSGAACWTQVYGNDGTGSIAVNKGSFTPYDDIKTGCAAIVNTDPNCVYAVQSLGTSGYAYDYIADNAFTTLFGDGTANAADKIGVVASLNSLLATSYNTAAIENMRLQCENVAKNCVRSMCGEDFVNCYRNRTDIASSLTKTNNATYNKSMNKVGGVLDYTIVLGLCVDTVKNADACNEHLKIAKAAINTDATANTWGTSNNLASSVRSGWIDAGYGVSGNVVQQKDAGKVQAINFATGGKLCADESGERGECNTFSSNKKIIDQPVMITIEAFRSDYAANSLFQELIADLEIEAQAKYNAKLTAQQNMCMAMNSGGIMGNNDMSAIYKWVKLDSDTVPPDYSIQGLESSDFDTSNDLYGSFCAVRVTLQSDDPDIMAALSGKYTGKTGKQQVGGKWDWNSGSDLDVDLSKSASRYFAIGDPITCGSWLSYADLEEIAQIVEAKAKSAKEKTQNTSLRTWMPILGAVGLGTGGMFLGNAIQKGDILGGLSGINKNEIKNPAKDADTCESLLDKAYGAVSATCDTSPRTSFIDDVVKACKIAKKYDDDMKCTTSEVENKIDFEDWYDEVSTGDSCDATKATKATKDAIRNLQSDWCDKVSQENTYEDGKVWWKNHGGQFLGGLISAGVGAGLTYAITDSALNAELDAAGQEAYQAFMDNIGSKIKCYIGSQELASYGQVIQTSMD